MTYDQKLQAILDAAQTHGSESEPDHEVGDLQDALQAAWDLMSNEQRDQLMEQHEIKELLENWSSYYDELAEEVGA